MSLYKRKPSEPIEATQFVDPSELPNGVSEHKTGLGQSYWAVTTMQGQSVRVSPGEWIVNERGCGGARHYPIADDEFRRLYVKAKD